jgi:FkbM family methyltransferase
MNISNLILDAEAKNHFNNPASMARIITNQIDSGFYSKFEAHIKNNTVLDCGANIGLFSIHCSQIANRVISVEPTRNHNKILKNLVLLNNVKNIEVDDSALSNKEGVMYFYENVGNSTMNSLFPYGNDGSTKYEVQVKTLKSLLENHQIADGFFLKMDIEGSESLLFDNDEFFNSLNKCGAFFMEVHDLNSMSPDVMRQLQVLWAEKIKIKCPNINFVEFIGVDGLFGTRGV